MPIDTILSQETPDYSSLLEHVKIVLVTQPDASSYKQARTAAEAAAVSAPRREDRAMFSQVLAQHCNAHGEFDAALRWIDEADRLSVGIPRIAAYTAYYRASILHKVRKSAQALDVLESITDIHEESDLSLASRIRTLHAGILDSLGRVDDAEEKYKEAIDLREHHGDPSGLAVVYYNYAELCIRRDDDERGLEYLLKAHDLEKELHLEASLAQSACQISLLIAKRGDRIEAERWYSEAREHAETAGVPIVIAFVKANAASLYEFIDDGRARRAALEDAKAYLEKHTFESIQGSVLGNLGLMYTTEGRYQEAETLIEKALAIAQVEQHRYAIGHWMYAKGALYNAQGRYVEAIEILKQSIDILKDVQAHVNTLMAYRELARAESMLGGTSESFVAMSEWADAYLLEHNALIQRRLQIVRNTLARERKEREEEIYRLRNVELSDTMLKLEKANKELRELATEKDEFMAIAAHDLRNPLADMRTMLQTVLNHLDVLSQEDILDICRDLLTTTTRMGATVHAFLEVSRTDGRSSGMSIEKLDLVHLAHTAIERHTSRAQLKGMTIEVNSTGHVWAMGDASIVDAVLDNLISNAVKFAPNDSPITIMTDGDNTDAWICVCDEGPGVASSERDRLFTKYARLSTKPTAGEESIGIGLYLSQRMATRMDAKLEYRERPEHGACFVLAMKGAE